MEYSRRKLIASISTITLSTAAAGCVETFPGTGPTEEDVSELEDEIEDLEGQIDDLEDREDTLETQLEEETRELQEQLAEEETTIEELQDRLEDAQSKTESLQEQLDEKDSDSTELRSQIRELETEVETLEQLLGDQHDFTDEELEQAYEVGNRARAAVFSVQGGTAFHVGDGNLVTNAHVIENAPEERFVTHYEHPNQDYNGLNYSSEDTSERDPDVGVLYSEADHLPELEFGDPRNVDEEQPLIAVGHPGNTGEYIIMLGRHKSFESAYEYNTNYGLHKSSIPSSSGASGSPVMTLDGKVVAVLHSGVSDTIHTAPDRVHTTLAWEDEITQGTSSIIIQELLDDWL